MQPFRRKPLEINICINRIESVLISASDHIPIGIMKRVIKCHSDLLSSSLCRPIIIWSVTVLLDLILAAAAACVDVYDSYLKQRLAVLP